MGVSRWPVWPPWSSSCACPRGDPGRTASAWRTCCPVLAPGALCGEGLLLGALRVKHRQRFIAVPSETLGWFPRGFRPHGPFNLVEPPRVVFGNLLVHDLPHLVQITSGNLLFL